MLRSLKFFVGCLSVFTLGVFAEETNELNCRETRAPRNNQQGSDSEQELRVLPDVVCQHASNFEGEQRQDFLRAAMSVAESCFPAFGSDRSCADVYYGYSTENQYNSAFEDIEREGDSLESSNLEDNPGAVAEVDPKALLQGSVCNDNRACERAELLTFNVGRTRSAAYGALYSGYVAAGETERGVEVLNEDSLISRQMRCAVDQTDFSNGECVRTVSSEDIRNDPYYEGDACRYLDDNFYGLCGMQELVSLSHASIGALDQCAGEGVQPEDCPLDISAQDVSLLDENNQLPEDFDGEILLASESFISAALDILPAQCQGKDGLAKCLEQNQSNVAGEIIPRRTEEEKGMLLYEQPMMDQESRMSLCRRHGTAGIMPPSEKPDCTEAYMEGYGEAHGLATNDAELAEDGSNQISSEKLFASLRERRETELSSGEDIGLAELVEVRAAFAALKDITLLEARNNADLFQRAEIWVGQTPMKASNIVNQANEVYGENSNVAQYESIMGGSSLGGSSFDSFSLDTSDSIVDSGPIHGGGGQVGSETARFVPRHVSEVDPESDAGIRSRVGATPGAPDSGIPDLQLAEEGGLSYPYRNVNDYFLDYYELSPEARARSVDTPALGVASLPLAEDREGNSLNMGAITVPLYTCDSGDQDGFLGVSAGQSPCGPVRSTAEFQTEQPMGGWF